MVFIRFVTMYPEGGGIPGASLTFNGETVVTDETGIVKLAGIYDIGLHAYEIIAPEGFYYVGGESHAGPNLLQSGTLEIYDVVLPEDTFVIIAYFSEGEIPPENGKGIGLLGTLLIGALICVPLAVVLMSKIKD